MGGTKQKSARVWWLVHQWAGLKLSILLSFILFTGTLAVFGNEIDWLLRPAMRVDSATTTGVVDWIAITRAVEADYPNDIIQTIEAPAASAFAATIVVERSDGAFHLIYAHPVTGVIQGEGSIVDAQQVLRNIHRHLNMPVWIGVPIVSALSLLLLVSLVTSLVVYKKWWRGWFRRVRTRDARTGWGDFHRLAGLWSLWFVLLMIVTSLWYLVEEVALRAPDAPYPTADVEPAKVDSEAAALTAVLARARANDPGLDIHIIVFPASDWPVFRLEGQRTAWLVRPSANTLWVSDGGEAILTTYASDLSAHQRISEAADPLHFGTWGGYPTRILWFLFGLLLTGLSVSGVTLHAMRLAGTKNWRGARRRLLGRAWHGMGVWRWPATALVATGFALLPAVFSGA